METEYVYPELGDRASVSDWVDDGRKSIWVRARERVSEILAGDAPGHLPAAADRAIRESFPIRLNREEQSR